MLPAGYVYLYMDRLRIALHGNKYMPTDSALNYLLFIGNALHPSAFDKNWNVAEEDATF